MPRDTRSADEAFESGEDAESVVASLLGLPQEDGKKPKSGDLTFAEKVEEDPEAEEQETEEEGPDDEGDGDEDEEEAEDAEGEPDDPELDFSKGLPIGVRKRLKGLTEKRNEARDRAAIAESRLAESTAEITRLKAEAEEMRAAAKDPEPQLDPDEPDTVLAWREWKDRDTERKIAAATRDKEREEAKAGAEGDVNSDLARAIQVAQKKHSDYARVVSKAVQAKIDNDPALYDRVWFDSDGRSAPEVAYEIGLELLGRKEKPVKEGGRETGKKQTRSTASGGYRGSAGRSTSKTLTPEERSAARMMRMTDKEYLEARDEQAI